MTSETPAKLPVWKTALECYRLTFRHLGDLLRFAWPWLLLLIAVSAALYWGFYPLEKDAMALTGTGSNVLWLSTLLASTAIGAAIAVPWHRLLLLGEQQNISQGLVIDGRRWSYLLKALLLIIVPMAPTILALNLAPITPDATEYQPMPAREMTATAAFIATILSIPLINRLSLILPASALDHNEIGWKKTWIMTRGNTWLLFWASLAVTLPLILVIYFVGIPEPTIPAEPIKIADVNEHADRTSFTIWSVVWEFAAMVTGMLYVTFLSLAYRHFRGLPVPGT